MSLLQSQLQSVYARLQDPEVCRATLNAVDIGSGVSWTQLSQYQTSLAIAQEAQQVTLEGQELIREVWGVVADYYLDARGAGFDLESWTKLRDTYLSQPLSTHDSAYRCASALHGRQLQKFSKLSACLQTTGLHIQ